MVQPDFRGGSLVNLMVTLTKTFGGDTEIYSPLEQLDLAQLRDSRNVVLVVIDGLGHEYLTAAREAPVLQRHLQGRMTSVFPSTTAAAITTFMTGLAPQQHGLTGWHMYLKELGCVAAILPFRPRCGGSPFGQADIDAAKVFRHPAVFDRLNARSHVVAPRHILDSDFNRVHSGAALRRGYTDLHGFFERVVSAIKTGPERNFIYAYWPELDRLAHDLGIGSEEVAAHLRELDSGFATFLERIAGSDTTVVITSDHGFLDYDPQRVIQLDEHPDLAETLILPLCGERRVAYCYVRAHKHAQFENYVMTQLDALTALYKSEDLVQEGWFGVGDPHPRLRERIGDYTLVMKDNALISDWIMGERHFTQVGVHGGISPLEMYVPLITASP